MTTIRFNLRPKIKLQATQSGLAIGPRGLPGEGPEGKSAYEVAVDNGFEGTEEEWLATFTQGMSAYEVAVANGYTGTESQWLLSLKGDQGDPFEYSDFTPQQLDDLKGTPATNIELQKTATHIQWRLVGGTWADLVALDDVTGAPGTPATNIELQKTATHIQWRLVGGEWANLVALDDLKGAPGSDATVNATNIATVIAGVSPDTIVDEDYVPWYKTTGGLLKKITWANILTMIRTALFGSVSGILKANGSGVISAASAGTDFQAPLTFGIADTNKVQINSATVANGEFAKFTATGLESRTGAEVLSDIGAQAALTKAAYTDVDTGTDDAKYMTSLSLRSSKTAFEVLGFALSDETTALTTGQKIAIYMPFDLLVTRAYAEVTTAPTDATLQIDIEDGGSSILNAVLGITSTNFTAETSSFTGATSSYQLHKGDLLTADIDQIGSTVAGKGAKVYLEGYR